MLKKVLLIGGDERAARMASLLAADGYETQTLGLFSRDERLARPAEAEALVFPYPRSAADGLTPTFTGLSVHPQDVLAAAKPGTLVLSGAGLENWQDSGEALGLTWKRYESDESFLQANAEISAEAAVFEAMRMTDTTLMDLTALVTGYGRFGRALALRLAALGAQVWVAARREQQRAWARSDGLQAVGLKELAQVLPRVGLVLNTVPAPVFSPDSLSLLPRDAALMELASAPYGFDLKAAAALGLKAQRLPGLPARYAPASAAGALKQAVRRLLEEETP